MMRARSLEPIRKQVGREEVLRAFLQQAAGEPGVRVTGPQGSGRVSSMSAADCLIVLPPEVAQVRAGEVVDVILMDSLG